MSAVRNIFQVTLSLLRAVPHAYRASRTDFILLGALLCVQGLLQPLIVYATSETLLFFEGDAWARSLLWLSGLWAVIVFLEVTSGPLSFLLGGRLNERLTTNYNVN